MREIPKTKSTSPHLLSYSSDVYRKAFNRCAELFLISVANEHGIPSDRQYPSEIVKECKERLELHSSLWGLIGYLAFDCMDTI